MVMEENVVFLEMRARGVKCRDVRCMGKRQNDNYSFYFVCFKFLL